MIMLPVNCLLFVCYNDILWMFFLIDIIEDEIKRSDGTLFLVFEILNYYDIELFRLQIFLV